MRGLIATVMLAAALPAHAAAPSVKLPPAPGFVIGFNALTKEMALLELVPTGQNVMNFTKMITLMTMPGFGKAPPPAILAEFAKRYQASCPRSTVLAVPVGRDRGVRIDCPRHPNTGKTDTVFARALPVGRDMALIQITLRYSPLPRDAQWARDYLGGVTIL